MDPSTHPGRPQAAGSVAGYRPAAIGLPGLSPGAEAVAPVLARSRPAPDEARCPGEFEYPEALVGLIGALMIRAIRSQAPL